MRTSPPPPKSVKTIYISGPISGLDPQDAERAFLNAQKQCEELGYKVVNPMTLVPYDPALEWVDYMEKDLTALILDCDAVFVLEGSQASKGARLEITVAICLVMPIYHAGCMPPRVDTEPQDQVEKLFARWYVRFAYVVMCVAAFYGLIKLIMS